MTTLEPSNRGKQNSYSINSVICALCQKNTIESSEDSLRTCYICG